MGWGRQWAACCGKVQVPVKGIQEPVDCTVLTFQAHHTLLLGSGHVGLRNLGNTVRAVLASFLTGMWTGAGDRHGEGNLEKHSTEVLLRLLGSLLLPSAS